jgi:hypothetical protein
MTVVQKLNSLRRQTDLLRFCNLPATTSRRPFRNGGALKRTPRSDHRSGRKPQP